MATGLAYLVMNEFTARRALRLAIKRLHTLPPKASHGMSREDAERVIRGWFLQELVILSFGFGPLGTPEQLAEWREATEQLFYLAVPKFTNLFDPGAVHADLMRLATEGSPLSVPAFPLNRKEAAA